MCLVEPNIEKTVALTAEEPKETSPFDGIRPTLAHIPMDEIIDIIHDSHELA